jgi:P pilus assembly chaperone PapD
MRKSLILVLSLLVSTALLVLLPLPAAEASGWEWRQDDWSGGPGQQYWIDDAMYANSSYIDTMSEPGTLRVSYLASPFTKEPMNPVLAPGVLGSWDDAMVSGLGREREGGGYEVYYRGLDTTGINAIGYADSPDGISWTKYAGNPIIQGSGAAWDAGGVGTGPYLREGDTLKYWFSGYPAAGSARAFGFATSTDKVNWTRETAPALSPGAAGSWDETPQQCAVIKDGPTYHMWYYAQDSTVPYTGQIGHATSSDGKTFTKDPANPVLGPGAGGSWDDTTLGSFTIMRRPWLGDYIMAYSGYNGANYAIGTATSPDGVNWTKSAGNPVLLTGGPGSWNENQVVPFTFTYDGSTYKLGLYGLDSTGRMSSGEAFSVDGAAWTYNFANPILTPSAAPFWDDALTIAGFKYLEGNNVRTFYFGAGTSAAMGTATSPPVYYGAPASLESSVFDAGSTAQWGNVTWNETVPAGCSATVKVRTGNVPVPDGSWTLFTAVPNGGAVPHPPSRFVQYRVEMTASGPTTPVLSNLAIDLNALPTTWYFAEGYTGTGFDEWITIQNPNANPSNVTVTYFTPGGVPTFTNHNVPANSRYTIYVNSDLGADLENSFSVWSDEQVIVERPMYFRYSGLGGHDWRGGHDAMGSTQLSRKWYFAEGYTGTDFEEWLTIQNPNATWATVDVIYYVNGGQPRQRQHLVAPTSRYTISVNQDAGADIEVSTAISADQPILVERPMYFAYQGSMDGGHIVMGSPYLAQDWYLAEGATFDPFTEYITIQNPNPAAATVAVAYYTPGGVPITRNHNIPAGSRYTINAGADSGVASDLSAYLHANLPILVERPMYFNMLYGGLPGGHCAMGVNSPSTQWYFGEGYTGPGFDEWLTVQNPGPVPANLTVTYYVQGAAPITRNHAVAPTSRFTIPVNVDAGTDLQLSAYVLSDQPVICERPMYFFYQGYHSYNWPGGHDSQGFAP